MMATKNNSMVKTELQRLLKILPLIQRAKKKMNIVPEKIFHNGNKVSPLETGASGVIPTWGWAEFKFGTMLKVKHTEYTVYIKYMNIVNKLVKCDCDDD